MKEGILTIIVVTCLFVVPLSQPISNHVIVVLSEDSHINEAIEVMSREIPNVVVVEYGSPHYFLTIHRAVSGVTWISHGSDEGIIVGNSKMSWFAFSKLLDVSPSRDIILSCESSAIYEYKEIDDVMGFSGPIDAILSSLIVSFLVTGFPGLLQDISRYASSLLNNEIVPSLLYTFDDYIVGQMSYWEALYWTAMAMLTFGAIIFNYYTSFSIAESAAYTLVTLGQTAIIITLAYYQMGHIDVWQAAAEIAGWLINDMVEAFIEVLSGDLFAMAIFTSCVIVTIAAWGASAGTIATAQVAAALIAGIAFAINIVNDLFDADTIVG